MTRSKMLLVVSMMVSDSGRIPSASCDFPARSTAVHVKSMSVNRYEYTSWKFCRELVSSCWNTSVITSRPCLASEKALIVQISFDPLAYQQKNELNTWPITNRPQDAILRYLTGMLLNPGEQIILKGNLMTHKDRKAIQPEIEKWS